jgi:hypothetical protein
MPTLRGIHRPLALMALAAALALAPQPARGVIIQTLSGTGNTTAPHDDPGWNNVSFRGNGTAVYVGNGWVLTANHVTGGNMTFGGQTYAEVPGTAFSLTNNAAAGKTANTDLKMFPIDGIPAGLPTLAIASTTPTAGTAMTMIGGGVGGGGQAAAPWVYRSAGCCDWPARIVGKN